MSKQDVISLENTRFREHLRENDGGSAFLGYLYAELVIADAINSEDGTEDLTLGMPDLAVMITADGKPFVSFPPKRAKDGELVRRQNGNVVDAYFTASAKSREVITSLVFAIPTVSRSVERYLRKQDAA